MRYLMLLFIPAVVVGCASGHTCPLGAAATTGNCSSAEQAYEAAVAAGARARYYDTVFHEDLRQ